MPTPFNHIVLAERIREKGGLPRTIREQLSAHRPAFLLGNTAPDFGSLTGRARSKTHFFSVPIRNRRPAHLRVIDQHPALADPTDLPASHALFLAGYWAHLWLDQLWISTIFEPYFARVATPGSFHGHLIAHNLLRAHLDRLDRTHLPQELDATLRSASPRFGLPFAPDDELIEWREHLAAQLEPGGQAKTIEVFAGRLGLNPADFGRRLESREAMKEEVFNRLPRGLLRRFWGFAREASTELIKYYLEGKVEKAPTSGADIPRELPSLAARSEDRHEGYRTI